MSDRKTDGSCIAHGNHWCSVCENDQKLADLQRQLSEARGEIERLRNDVHVLESDCFDGTCHACVKCCDLAQRQLAEAQHLASSRLAIMEHQKAKLAEERKEHAETRSCFGEAQEFIKRHLDPLRHAQDELAAERAAHEETKRELEASHMARMSSNDIMLERAAHAETQKKLEEAETRAHNWKQQCLLAREEKQLALNYADHTYHCGRKVGAGCDCGYERALAGETNE